MSGATARSGSWAALKAAGVLSLLVGATGCQVDIGGQTLPSPFYQQDDVQYYPAGPEFKLSREAAALKAAKARERLRLSGAPSPAEMPGGIPSMVPGPAPGPDAELPGPGIAPAPGEEGFQLPAGVVPPPAGGPADAEAEAPPQGFEP